MSEHAPGPWEAQNTAGHDLHGQTAVYDANGKDVAIVYDGTANAPLIAAAPELLDALKSLLEGIAQNVMISARLGGKRDAHERITRARAAIAKTEGGDAMRGAG